MANILIVDDQIDLLELTADLLERVGHTVKSSLGGVAGLVSMETGVLPDCVILDVDMPGMNGPTMAHEMLIKDVGKEKIPILLVSGRDDLLQLAAKMGTPYFLKKGDPKYGKDLIRILNLALKERTAPASA